MNENNFFGGEFRFNTTDSLDTDCCLLTIDDSGGYKQNNNHFYSPSFERGNTNGAKCCYVTGEFNQIFYARAEQTGVIELAAGSRFNAVTLGYDDYNTSLIVDNGSQNFTQTRQKVNYSSDVDGVFTIRNVGSNNYKNIRLLDTSNNERFFIKASGKVFSNQFGYFQSGLRFNTVDGTRNDRGIFSGSGSPESVVSARIGSMYLRADGGANTTLYVKESGTGNIGWVAK
ncbi:hypothetical protein LRR81_09945 [Metabacillus sp. GX 13764]|uniref:hypothetical protein n=1 Tax=Metabacillus kandeliae TaxID=2900151 RepID=UPI001E658F82|nr:hypothetical protein [Metabacillus kandeliae]MCD7034561.1 hypothetical protein [Metabacillus kandeliae]